jgi:hypothetical protein
MSEPQDEPDRTYFTGDRTNYRNLLDAFNNVLANEKVSYDARAIAYAIRVGLAEQAIELSSIAGFGVDQATRRKAS